MKGTQLIYRFFRGSIGVARLVMMTRRATPMEPL